MTQENIRTLDEILENTTILLETIASEIVHSTSKIYACYPPGEISSSLFKFDEAISYYEKSINLYHETDQITKEAQAIFDMVSTFLKLGFDQSDIKRDMDLKKNIERALFIYKSVGNDLFYQRSQDLQKKLN